MIEVLIDTRLALARPGNDFGWSAWQDANDALEELEHLIRQLQNDEPIDQVKLEVLFAPTGPVQEVSMSSGWATEFLELAERFDAALGTST